jgi:hypothetical protein
MSEQGSSARRPPLLSVRNCFCCGRIESELFVELRVTLKKDLVRGHFVMERTDRAAGLAARHPAFRKARRSSPIASPHPPIRESVDFDDSELCRDVQNFFARLPWVPA